LKSYFITGTDTDVGKTWITAGIASALKKMGIDVGIMKPFAAGTAQKTGFKSEDVQRLANAAQVNDPEELVNPQFFLVPASPYSAAEKLGVNVDIESVLQSFKKLSSSHKIMLVEGIGGILTPILEDYYVANLIKDLDLDTILVTTNRIGTVNHTLMTCKMCTSYDLKVQGIIINSLDQDGYLPDELKKDLETLTGIPVLGIIPKLDNFEIESLRNSIENEIDLQSLII
jgi:dethiobiotin synthetase